MSLPNTFKNPWACENTIHGSGFKGMELELFACPKCGSEPSMVDEYPSVGMICINCGFGIRPRQNEVQAVKTWQKAVRQYCEVNRRVNDGRSDKQTGPA